MKSQVPRAQKGNIMNTTSRISVNAINSSIVVSKAFYKKACAYGTNEYTLLHKAMSENPAYQVVIAEVKKQAYSKLTFDRIKVKPILQLLVCEGVPTCMRRHTHFRIYLYSSRAVYHHLSYGFLCQLAASL